MGVINECAGERGEERKDRKTGNKPEVIRVSDGMLGKLGKTGRQDLKKNKTLR